METTETTMPHLSLSVLGPFQAWLDGRPITNFKSIKVRALLAYLVVEADRPHTREALAGLLWPDYPDRSALDNLRYTLSDLRRAIGDRRVTPPFLRITRDTIQFNTASDYVIDLTGLENLSGLAPIDRLCAAIEHYRGYFLAGFSSDSALFEEWALYKREQINRQLLSALHQLTSHYEQCGEYDRAAVYARKQLELEPWDEEAHQQLMRALALSGQRSAALAQYEACRRLLLQELGVEPSHKTVTLRDQIEQELIGAAAKVTLLNNLPIPLTPFVGRQREIAELQQLLAPLSHEAAERLTVRLLTLTGVGGCGKTRLAIQVADQFSAAPRFQHGVWWIDLAGLGDLALVPQAVATVFGLRESSATPLITTLTNYLRAKEMLLVLDNCEHLLDACARLAETLLSACPQLQILATSREPIGLTGEVVWRVPSLALPDAEHQLPNQLLQYDAIRLFVERATRIAPDWELSANAATVVRICRRLDGIPLAIELAAARLRVLSVEQLAARLDDRFHLLTQGSRTALPRHQTLRATVDWSYSFLSDDEQRVFQRLAVFAGGWLLEAAEQVASDDRSGSRPSDILDQLTHLVDKSLVTVEKQAGEVRYRMLETIREYAREKLITAGETEVVRQRQLAYLVQYADRMAPQLRGPEQKFWLDQIEAEQDNLRAALDWSLGRDSAADTPVEMGVRLVVVLAEFWDRRNYWREGHAWLARVLAVFPGETAVRAQVCHYLCRLERYRGDLAAARLHLKESLRLFQMWGDTAGVAMALLERAAIAERHSDFTVARSDAEESLRLFQRSGDSAGLADAFHRLGHVTHDQGDMRLARSYFDESLRLFQETGDKSWIGILLDDLALMAYYEGDYPAARAQCEAALALERELGYKYSMVVTLSRLGQLAHVENDYHRAAALYEESLALAYELDSRYLIAALLPDIGYVALRQNDRARAQQLFEESLKYMREQDEKDGLVECLAGLAAVAVTQGRLEYAARLCGAVEAQLAQTGYVFSPAGRMEYERDLAALRTPLGDEVFAALKAEGRALTMEQAVEYATRAMWDSSPDV